MTTLGSTHLLHLVLITTLEGETGYDNSPELIRFAVEQYERCADGRTYIRAHNMENIYFQFCRYVVLLVDSFEWVVALSSFQVSCADNPVTSRNQKLYAMALGLLISRPNASEVPAQVISSARGETADESERCAQQSWNEV